MDPSVKQPTALRHRGAIARAAVLCPQRLLRIWPAILILWELSTILAITLFLIPGVAASQSLGEIARGLREARRERPPKAVKVYTNDDLAKFSQPETAPPSAMESSPATARPLETKASLAPQPLGREAMNTVKTKNYWEAKFHHARSALARAKEERQLTEDELSLLQIQQIRELDPNLSTKLEGRISAKKEEVEIKRKAENNAQRALDKLNKEFEESGAPEDWRGQRDLR